MDNQLLSLREGPGFCPLAVGLAADHAGFRLKETLLGRLATSGCEVRDFGAHELRTEDDYPDRIIPLVLAVARGDLPRGIALCGTGVGACIVANKVSGVRASVVHDSLSARQGVEDDDMNILCLGANVIGTELAWELVVHFLSAQFTEAPRHRRRLESIALLERRGGY